MLLNQIEISLVHLPQRSPVSGNSRYVAPRQPLITQKQLRRGRVLPSIGTQFFFGLGADLNVCAVARMVEQKIDEASDAQRSGLLADYVRHSF